jgi:hypothetical protein
MFSALFQFTLQNLFYLALHLEPGGAFPKQLSKKEEQECLAEVEAGDECARNRLIVHNLRLVRHEINTIALKPSIYRHYSVFFAICQGFLKSSAFCPCQG